MHGFGSRAHISKTEHHNLMKLWDQFEDGPRNLETENCRKNSKFLIKRPISLKWAIKISQNFVVISKMAIGTEDHAFGMIAFLLLY